MEQRALTVEGLNSFIAKVFMWMFAGLLLTAATSAYVASQPSLVSRIFNGGLFWVFIIAEFGLVIALTRGALKYSYQKTVTLFMVYSFVNGITLSIIFIAYSSATITSAFLTAAVIFGVMALYGYATKTDLTGAGTFLKMALIGMVVTMVINMFMQSSVISYVISLVGVVVFSGLTAYDMQKIKGYYTLSVQSGGKLEGNLAVTGALTLYLDFINLFLMLLRIFGRSD